MHTAIVIILMDGPGTATRYMMKDPRIESLCGATFPHPSVPAQVLTHHHIQQVSVHSGGKAARTWR
jgi:hypothetical protein